MSIDASLRARARAVIPGGLWGHLNAAKLPEGYPQYFARADGAYLWDVDGRKYVDFMCSWGPVVLGHHHQAVEDAARRQAALGDCMNGPAPVLVDLAERLVDMIPHADWCLLAKNGADATTGCVTIARAGTGRRKLLVARGSYHGAVPWCSPSIAGVTAEDRAHLLHFDYNDVASLEAAVDQAGADLAAIIVTSFRHDMGVALELPTPEFAQAARRLCDATGAALILDDVRAGFRLDLRGSWEPLGVRPDLSALQQSHRQRPRPRRHHRRRALPRRRDRSLHHRLLLVRCRLHGRRPCDTHGAPAASTAPPACAPWVSACATASPPSRPGTPSPSCKVVRRKCH